MRLLAYWYAYSFALLGPHLNDHLQGSSALAPFYSVRGLIDTIQIFALLLSTIGWSIKHHAQCCW